MKRFLMFLLVVSIILGVCWACSSGSSDCIFCDGTGQSDCVFCDNGIDDCAMCVNGINSRGERCSYCNGTGTKVCTFCNGVGHSTCNQCNGSGRR